IDVRHLPQHRRESRAPVVVLFRREVRSAVEHLALGRQKRGERPAALSREGLDGALVARVHVGSLVAVYLDAHEVGIEQLRHPGPSLVPRHVSSRYLTTVRERSSAPTTRLSSSMSNLGL